MGVREPRRTLVIEIRERAFRQLLRAFFIASSIRRTNSSDPAGIGFDNETRPWTVNRSGKFEDARRCPFRGVERVLAQLIQFFGRGRDVDFLLPAWVRKGKRLKQVVGV